MPVSHHALTVRMVLSAIVAVLALMNAIYRVHRLASYRKDRSWERTTFGLPIESNWATLNRSNYTADATGAYIATLISAIALIAAMGTAFWAWW
jgi:hypothetical protein